jgi:hypothetical protein
MYSKQYPATKRRGNVPTPKSPVLESSIDLLADMATEAAMAADKIGAPRAGGPPEDEALCDDEEQLLADELEEMQEERAHDVDADQTGDHLEALAKMNAETEMSVELLKEWTTWTVRELLLAGLSCEQPATKICAGSWITASRSLAPTSHTCVSLG